MTGAGNDFVVIDNRDMLIRDDVETFAQRVCNRKFGVGSDGLLLLERSTRADFLMRFFNPDGSSGMMCGNGGRCIAKFALELGVVGKEMTFEVVDFIYRATVLENSVRLRMKNPTHILSLPLQIDDKNPTAYFINTGAPHVVLFSNEFGIPLEQLDVEAVGRQVRWHRKFQPEGTNVNVVQVGEDNRLYNRTYERGVECETLACGTGSVATALVVAYKLGMPPPVYVQTQSGKVLVVDFRVTEKGFTDIILEGDACVTFVGQLQYDAAQKTLVW